MKCIGLTASVVTIFVLSGCAPNTVGTKNRIDALTVQQDNPSPSSIVQISPGDAGGSTTINTIGPVQQTFVDPDGTLRSIGGGVANKVIAMKLPDGSMVLLGSQDDAAVGFDELYSGGKLIAKGITFTTNVSAPTLAHAELVKAWGPTYALAVEQARLGNKDLYDSVVEGLKATPAVIAELAKLYGVP